MSIKRKHALPIFPWDSDSDNESLCSTRTPPSPQKVEGPGEQEATLDGIRYNLLCEETYAGKVFAHCQACVEKLRATTGGESLAIYKIGITHDCEARFRLYQANGWSKMLVMFRSSNLSLIEMLEVALVSHHKGRVQCRNMLPGGEGMRDKLFNAKFKPPYFCYCTAARADLPRWVR